MPIYCDPWPGKSIAVFFMACFYEVLRGLMNCFLGCRQLFDVNSLRILHRELARLLPDYTCNVFFCKRIFTPFGKSGGEVAAGGVSGLEKKSALEVAM